MVEVFRHSRTDGVVSSMIQKHTLEDLEQEFKHRLHELYQWRSDMTERIMSMEPESESESEPKRGPSPLTEAWSFYRLLQKWFTHRDNS